MSGVVLNLKRGGHVTASAAADDDDDDDDVAGLLAEEEEEDDGTGAEIDQLEPGRSGGFRRKKSRPGKRGTRRYGRDPYTVVRSTGTLGQLFNTLMLCCVFFGLGFTKALLDQSKAVELEDSLRKSDSEDVSPAQTTSSVGYLVGFLIGGFLLSHFSRFFVLVLGTVILSLSLSFVPWTTARWSVNATYGVVGVTLAVLMAGGNVICLDYWGRRSGPYVQALHFCLSLGLLTGPLLIEPLSQTQIPRLVQKTLHAALGNASAAVAPVDASGSSSSSITLSPPSTPKYDIRLKRSVDPLLLELFGERKGRAERPKKPSFTDGTRLDRSRDWEKVKVGQPPLQEVMPPLEEREESTAPEDGPSIEEVFKTLGVSDRPAASTGSGTTKSPMLRLIEEEMEALEKDMERSGRLMQMLRMETEGKPLKEGEGKELKREKRGIRNRNGFDPAGYEQQRRFPKPNRYPSQEPGWRLNPESGWDRDYDYDPRLGLDPFQRRQEEVDYPMQGPLTPPLNPLGQAAKPPKKLEDAIETIQDYLDGKNLTEVDEEKKIALEDAKNTRSTSAGVATTASTKAKGTTATTTAATTATKTTTTTTTKYLEVQKKSKKATTAAVAPKPKKPTSSFDNDTDAGVSTLTIENVLSNYGVTKPNVGFILDAVYTLLLSLVLMVCLCYHPREPRSRQEEGSKTTAHSENRIFKCTLLMLLFCFTLLHWGMFVSLREVLPKFNILAATASYLQQVFVGVFTATRFLLSFASAGLLSPAVILFLGLVVTFAGSLTLVFAQEISAAAVWAGVIMQSVGLSTLLPTSLVWGEVYILMTPQVVAVICSGMALGELGVPLLLERLTLEAQTWLGFTMLGATTLSLGLFVCVFLVARKHGSRFSRPQTAGYELANQDELNQDLLDEDEEDFEVAEPTLRLQTVKEEPEEA